ncbi:MAG: hypothetical protein ACREAJ_00570 [Nitrosopumilaceae archaeon]
MKKEEKCILCNNSLETKYIPMEEWKIDGTLCGKCYSKKISEFYPGEHVRVNLTDE